MKVFLWYKPGQVEEHLVMLFKIFDAAYTFLTILMCFNIKVLVLLIKNNM